MLDPLTITIVLAVASLVVPTLFLVVMVVAVMRRSRGVAPGPRTVALLTLLGGLTLGTFFLFGAGDLLVGYPPLAAALLFAIILWRRRRRSQAGWIVTGTALPWTILWTVYLGAFVFRVNDFDPGSVILGLAAGAIPLAIGLFVVAKGDPTVAPSPAAPPGEPGSRRFGSIAAAVRGPSLIGPFGVSEIAALVALVAVFVVIQFALPRALHPILAISIPSLIGAVAASEAYMRAMPDRARRAFEAFSWLGEWELARGRAAGGGRVPTTPATAESWLLRHPDKPSDRWLRTEILLLAGRIDEARTTAAAMPDTSPYDRVERAAAQEMVDWYGGGDGGTSALEAAVAELASHTDERLRGEVSVALAKVRRIMADPEGGGHDRAIEPLLAARDRLGARADGQVGRAYRRRLYATFFGTSLVFGAILYALSWFGGA